MNIILLTFILFVILNANECNLEQYKIWKQFCHNNINGNYQIWKNNCLDFHQIKDKSNLYQLDLCKNQFADIEKPIQTIKIISDSPPQQHTVTNQFLTKVSAAYKGIDWRDSGSVTPVRNQGSCGCCWAFVTAAMFQSHFAIHNASKFHVSQQFILQCTQNNSTCGGGYINYALNTTIERGGIPNATLYPYLGYEFNGTGTPTTSGICNTSSDNYYNFSKNMTMQQYNNVNITFLESLLQNGPVGALFYADSGFMSYTNGVYSCGKFANSSDLNHAVLIVGYKSDDTLIIKNSYGTGWGINGYAYINSSFNNCGIMISVFQLTFEISLKLGMVLLLLILTILS